MQLLEKISERLDALGNPTRLAIYRLLVRAGDKGLPVGDIQGKMVPALSRRLASFIRLSP